MEVAKQPPSKRQRVSSENDGVQKTTSRTSTRRDVHFPRDPKIESQRSGLPVYMHEQEIIEAVRHNDAVVITGATGSGKTTQVPQFLLEEILASERSGMVVVTQPRRVAAVACARRVAEELGEKRVGALVGHHVRHSAVLGAKTRLKFVTDGVLLREAEHDIMLQRYACIVVDEAHERSLNTDLLLALLSRTLVLRRKAENPLTLVIMSATLDVDGILKGDAPLFPRAPIVAVPARQHPVTMHFARATHPDYVAEALVKTRKIHTRLPPGHVLVFLSGRREVLQLCAQLEREFGGREVRPEGSREPLSALVLPFYALLPDAQQARVFAPVEERTRKIVVATNVAETSVTIPDVTYVVDSGKVKELSNSGLMSSFDVVWTSKASAEQRMGRAGRTGPGHCYRLYSSAVFDQQFAAFREPEVLRVPADAVVLRLRALGIVRVEEFPFPSRPEPERLLEAQRVLEMLGALEKRGTDVTTPLSDIAGRDFEDDGNEVLLGVTSIGREIAKIPAPPRYARMVLSARMYPKTLPLVCRAAALLSLGTVLERGSNSQAAFAHPNSDVLTQLRAVCAAEKAGWAAGGARRDDGAVREFCTENSLHFKTLMEVLATAKQLEESVYKAADKTYTARTGPVSQAKKVDEKMILRAMVCGFPDQIARRLSRDEASAFGVPARWRGCAFSVAGCKEPAYLPSGSPVRLGVETEYVVFGKLMRAGHEKRGTHGNSNSGTADLHPGEDEGDYIESEDEAGDGRGGADDSSDCGNSGAVKRIRNAGRQGEEANVGGKKKGMIQGGSSDQHEWAERVLLENVSCVCASWLASNASAVCSFAIKKGATAPARALSRSQSETAAPAICSYDPSRDCVMVPMTVLYGRAKWPMGTARLRYRVAAATMADADDRTRRALRTAACAAFAGALADGRVPAVRSGGHAKKRPAITARLVARDIASRSELSTHVGDVATFLNS